MQRSSVSWIGIAGLGLASGVAMGALQGCDPSDLAEQCGLVCPAEGILEGNASISGVAGVDAFFGAVIGVRDAAANVSAGVRAELEGMAGVLGIEGAAELEMGELVAQVSGQLEAEINLKASGGLTIKFQEPRCEASLEASVSAAAECDVEADPGSIEASCEGSCEVSAEVAADCQAEGMLTCEGQAPGFDCQGTCTGSCQLEVAAGCSGTCNGSCDGMCTVCAGGDCDQQGNVVANCAGACEGSCQGECKLEAGGDCGGRCEGSCEYTPASASCEAGATARCDVSAMADAQCQGRCEGNVEPPEVSAECEAAVEAKAKASVECTPPQLTVDFQFAAGLDADAKAEFKALIQAIGPRFAGMLAARAKLQIVVEAIAELRVAAQGAVKVAVEETLEGDADLKATIGLGCALVELEAVGEALGSAEGDLTGSIDAVGSIAVVFGGG